MLMNIISVIIGGILAIAGGIAAQMYQHRKTAQAIKCSLLAEIAATLEILEARRYIPFIERLIAERKVPNQPFSVVVSTSDHSFLVYKTNADKLGYLPPDLAGEIAKFYALIFSVIEDAKEPPFGQNPRERSVAEWEQTLKLAKEAITIGKSVTGTAGVPTRTPGSVPIDIGIPTRP